MKSPHPKRLDLGSWIFSGSWILVLGASAVAASGRTNYLAEVTPQVLQSAVDAAAEGDTILAGPGVFWWNTNVVVSPAISVIATGATLLYDNVPAGAAAKNECLFDFETQSNKSYRISGFQFAMGTNRSTAFSHGLVALYGYSHAVRVDHLTVSNCWNNGVYPNGWVLGVCDHSSFTFNRNQHGLFIHHPNWGGADYGFGDYSFYAPPTYGSSNAFYVEDCYFHNSQGYHGGVDGQGGARVVVRRCLFDHEYIGIHGHDSGGRLRGFRQVEFYENTFVGGSTSQDGIVIRGGCGPVFSNTFSGPWKRPVTLWVYRSHHAFPTWGGVTGLNPWDSNSPALYYQGAHVGADGAEAFAGAAPGWTSNQWIGYTISVAGGASGFGEIVSNSVDTIWVGADSVDGSQTLRFTNGVNYEIHLTWLAFGAPGHGRGDLLSGSSQGAAWAHDTIEPVYCWSNSFYGSNGLAQAVQTFQVKDGREFSNNVAMPGYAPFTYPHPLVEATAPAVPMTETAPVRGSLVLRGRAVLKKPPSGE